jgi:hypothetical protein
VLQHFEILTFQRFKEARIDVGHHDAPAGANPLAEPGRDGSTRAVSTDIVSFLARVAVTLTERPHPPSGVEPCRRSDDDRSHENGVSPAATL